MRAFIIGNATIDESFSVTAFPLPGETIKATAVNRCLGGKGANQAIILSRCGIDTTFITATADDPRGHEIRQLLSREKLKTRFVTTDGSLSDQSIILSRSDGENSVISTTACAEQLYLAAVEPILEQAQAHDSLILQGNLNYQASYDLFCYARRKGLHTVFNPSPVQNEFVHLWGMIDVLFLNSTEASTLTGQSGSSAAQYLLEQGIGQVVLTEGAAGAWVTIDNAIKFVPAKPLTAIDTTGAGDTFMSVAIGSAHLRGTQIDSQAMRHAHQAAAITVSQFGTVSAFPTVTALAALLLTSGNSQNHE